MKGISINYKILKKNISKNNSNYWRRLWKAEGEQVGSKYEVCNYDMMQ